MIEGPVVCGSDTIERFLTDRLDAAEQRAFEKHLDSCDACCRALKEKAADARWWDDARSYLGSEASRRAAGDRSVPGTTTSPGEGAAAECNRSLEFLAPSDDPRMLGRFGGYEIAGVIGRGGMGIVLKGFDGALNRNVAIKVLSPHLAESGSARRRFAREAQAAAAVVHENVIAIHGVDEERGLPYLVMPYFRGTSLQKRLDQEGPLATCEVLRIGMQTAAGLAAAHAQGLVHRDIKPANILLSESVERVKITDFGLARAADDASVTRSGIIAGTPQYMSPEQARGESVDARSDLFSLGSVMYAMSTGRLPFRAETSYGILKRIADTHPRPIRGLAPETPEWLCRLIGKLLEKSANDRVQTAAEVADVLEQCLAHIQNPAQPLPPWLLDGGGVRRLWLRWSAAAAVALSILAGTLVTISNPISAPSRSIEHLSGANMATNLPPQMSAATATDPSEILWEDGTANAVNEIRSRILDLDARSQSLWESVNGNSNPNEE